VLQALDFDAGSWDPVIRAIPFAVGVFLLGFTTLSLLRTMVIPRATPSLLSAAVGRATNNVFWGLARIRRTFRKRDRVLAWNGSIVIFTTLAAWLALYVLAYALMLYGISDYSFLTTVVAAGSSVFTLGLVGSPTLDQTYVEFLAAATGPVVIALLIGFLPTMYSAYTERETQASLFGSLAGEPAWGPEFLIRTHMLSNTSNRGQIYAAWTKWSATVRLTQTLYPPLNRLRSPIAQRHWLISLLAVLDAAALESAVSSKGPRMEAMALIEEGSLTMNSLLAAEWGQRDLRTLRRASKRALKGLASSPSRDKIVQELRSIPADSDRIAAVRDAINHDIIDTGVGSSGGDILKGESAPITLPRSEFDKVIAMLTRIKFPMDNDVDAAWNYFSKTRQRYEYAAYQLAQIYYVVPAPWSGPRTPAVDTIVPASALDALSSDDS
jgi:hypothetical protein